uniref:Uncharacterized protein n=1 Tax=Vespula pensylvanica TaxID=30213 RepID=A0A834K0L5_VESPE|nr:hypothetical protein H0235_016177 [Vespula pensylvanica]
MSMCEGFDRAIGGSRVGDDLKDDWKWRRHARNPDRVNTGVRMGGWMMWAESGWFVLATQEEWWDGARTSALVMLRYVSGVASAEPSEGSSGIEEDTPAGVS